ncbi:MAG: pyridoxamine 5'-phosphate oxidase family protein [Cyanobacteria bacterium P01_D01_bin.56]
MADVFTEMTSEHQKFIQSQSLFFVATAPLVANGHVNMSPKGLDTFRVFSPTQVGYLDLTGSGNETSAHVAENGRITLMFCSFDQKPLILRLYGHGQVILPTDDQWPQLVTHFELLPGVRQMLLVNVHRVQTSCGYGVPVYSFQGQRPTLPAWAHKKGPDALADYQVRKGSKSIDGLVTPLGQENAATKGR